MRLIDADALFKEVIYQGKSAKEQGFVSVYNGLAIACGEINDAPTIEAEPVRHGHWIHTGVKNVFGGHQHKCSVCGYSLMVSKACDNENYCCSCGAKMDEVTG